MKLNTTYSGSDDLFEGDRTVQLRSLPVGAHATKATVKVTPVPATGGTLFQETIGHFDSTGRGDLNATKVAVADFVEVDFHARRTLANVIGGHLDTTTLQVDVGGTFIDVNSRGALGGNDQYTLHNDNSPLPGLAVNKVRLTKSSANPDIITLTIRPVPTNLTVKLGQTPAFWVRVGELAGADTSPDFAEALNAFLLTAPSQDGFYQIPFVIHSDSLARLDVELDIDYVIEQSVLPPNLPEINLPYDFSTVSGLDETLITIKLPRDAVPVSGRTGAQIQGQFQPTRVAQGPVGEEPTPVPAEVSPQCSLAQAIQADHEIQVTGVDLPLGKTQADLTGLNVALRADDDGKPAPDVLASAEVKIAKPVPGQSTWGTATLATPFRILPGERYWLILQSRDNVATWNATTGPAVAPADPALPLQCSRDGSLSWRAATARDAQQKPLSALLRLRDKPDKFSIPVQLQIGKGPGAVRRRLDEYAPLGRIEFSFDFAEKLTEHLNQPELASPCGSDELLVNGSFDQPPPDDASRRLFGFDEGRAGVGSESAATLRGLVDLSPGVDLSVQRFITLSVDSGTPLRINCAGVNPAHTSLNEVITAINQAMGRQVAAEIIETDSGSGSGHTGKLEVSGETDIQLYLWCQAGAPAGWQGEVGRVVRAKLDERVFVALLAPPPTDQSELACVDMTKAAALDPALPAVLSQRVHIAGNCDYELQTSFRAVDRGHESAESNSQWQIDWLNQAGQILSTVSAPLVSFTLQSTVNLGLSHYETRVTAPQDAVEAELRFTQEPTGNLILSDASFKPTLETLSNGQFHVMEEASSGQLVPVSWNLVSGLLDYSDASGQPLATGIRLKGNAPDDSALTQVSEIIAGGSYILNVSSRLDAALPADSPSRSIQQRPRVELRWLNVDQPIGAPISLPLDGRDFPVRAWSGSAPAGANRAEIRFIQPRDQGNLIVESVALTELDQIEVPLIFLAETPGELKLSNFRVAYDRPEPPATAALTQLTSPTPVQAAKQVLSATSAAPTSIMAAAPRAVSIASPVVVARRPPLADQPITIVAGVGQRFSKILAGRKPPIATVADLAQIDPNAAIKGIPPEQVLELKVTAEMIMALNISAEPFAALANEAIDQLLALRPATLSRRADQPIVRVRQLQHDLRALRLLIKNDAFRKLRLSDVTSS